MDGGTSPDEKKMRLRYAGDCRVCGVELPAGSHAVYERSTRSVRCLEHDLPLPGALPGAVSDVPPDVPPAAQQEPGAGLLDVGTPGASARREFERRKARRETDMRARHPKLGGLIHALTDEASTTTVWDTGAIGEERLGNRLNELSSDLVRVLHDRRIPRSRANIDHLAVAPTGVYVIDAKRYSGRPRLQVEGGLLRPRTERLIVGRRDCTKLVDGMLKQVAVVRALVDDGVPVQGVLCFVDADWPLIGGDFSTRGVEVLWPKRLVARLQKEGPLEPDTTARLQRHLAGELPAA